MNGDRLKVAYVINGLGTGGAERSLRELFPRLRAEGIDLEVFCLHRRKEGVQDQVASDGFRVHFLRGSGVPSWTRDLRRHLRSMRPDIVHTTLFESDLVGRLAAWGTPSKVVTSLVNVSYDAERLRDPHLSRAKLRVVQAMDAVSARYLCDHFHAITEAVAVTSVRHLHLRPERITVVPRGRDSTRLGESSAARRRESRERLGVADDAQVVVNVGRQEFQKGQADLLEAMALLRKAHPSVLLLQVGRQGHETARLQDLAGRIALRDCVRFLGHREDVPEILAAADLFAFPSFYEGLGGALIEAMALGLPIVTTQIPAIQEVVESDSNALLVPPGRPEDLANAMRLLLDDKQLRVAYGRRSREIFEEKFTLERSADGMMDMYRALASR